MYNKAVKAFITLSHDEDESEGHLGSWTLMMPTSFSWEGTAPTSFLAIVRR